MYVLTQRNQEVFLPSREFAQIPVGSSGVATPSTFYDVEFDSVIVTGAYTNYSYIESSLITHNLTYENLTPSVCSVSSWPLVTRITDGVGRIRISSGEVDTMVSLVFNSGISIITKNVTGFVEGSYAAFSESEVTPFLTGGNLSIFTDSAFSAYNPLCWAAMYDFTGVSYWSSHSGFGNNPITMIAPRFGIAARHYGGNGVGTQFKFRKLNGESITRTVIATSATLPDYNDVLIVQLDADVPDGIAVYPVVGPWIFNPTGGAHNAAAWSHIGIKLNQFRQVGVTIQAMTYAATTFPPSGFLGSFDLSGMVTAYHDAGFVPEVFADVGGYYFESIIGDSGSPSFAPITNGGLAFVTSFQRPTSGPFPHEDFLNEIIAHVETVSGTNTNQTVFVAPDPTL